jgi:hypothetical protein
MFRHNVKTVVQPQSGQAKVTLRLRHHIIILQKNTLLDVDETPEQIGILALEGLDAKVFRNLS